MSHLYGVMSHVCRVMSHVYGVKSHVYGVKSNMYGVMSHMDCHMYVYVWREYTLSRHSLISLKWGFTCLAFSFDFLASSFETRVFNATVFHDGYPKIPGNA